MPSQNRREARLRSGVRISSGAPQELTAMQTADFNTDAGVATVRASKAGPRHVVLTEEGQRLFTTLIAASSAKSPGRWANGQVASVAADGRSLQANTKPVVAFHVLRPTHGSTLAVRGVPFGLIAEQLGGAATRG